MEYRLRVNILSSAAVIGLAIVASVVTSAAIASSAYRSRVKEGRRSEETITVKGSARQRIRSDLAVWTVRVTGEGEELGAAFGVLEAGSGQVLEFLVGQGFEPSQLVEGAINTDTHYARDEKGNSTREVTGYTLWRDFTVSTGDVELVAAAAGRVTELIKNGVAVVSVPPDYYYTKLPDLRVSILGEASKDARARADEIAGNAGFDVGEIRSVHVGVMQVVRPNSTDVSSGGLYDTGTIEKDVTAVVNLTFGIVGG